MRRVGASGNERPMRREFVLLLTGGFALGLVLAWSVLPPRVDRGPAPEVPTVTSVRNAAEPTLEERAARELARSRAAGRQVAPTLERARQVAAAAERRRRLPGGGRLVLGDVTPTHVVASIELAGGSGPARSVPADGGVHFAICAPRATRCTDPGGGASRAAVRAARQHGLELALRTFIETTATLVVVSVPRQAAGPPTALVFERRELLRGGGGAALLRLVERSAHYAERVARAHLFALAGLVAHSEARDSLVVRSLAP